jgi:pyruvate,water dikinase
MSELRTFDQIGPADGSTVGGKGLSLGLLARAGLPVPPGFCVTSSAYRRLKGQSLQGDPALTAQLTEAYRRFGSGAVAVRSSATAEDGAITSFAGQQETILGVQGESALIDAVSRCWASLKSERALAYRRRQGVEEDGLAMAVVIQQLVPAEVSGVLFTRDPLDAEGRRMLVEASWGLGESVVSGRVTPDRYHLDRESGAILDQYISTKTTLSTAQGMQEVPPEKQNEPCLTSTQLAELAELGRRVEAYYGDARDVEWAWADGRFWLLQARPITTAGAAEREQVRREEIAALSTKAASGGTVWSRYNLSEVLPEPTPMTWALARRFLSGCGGMGLMYRDLGFEPDRALDEESVYDLICGRPYCNLSREPKMYAQGLPLEHSFADLKASPHKALYPKAEPNWSRVGWRFWLLFPATFFKTIRLTLRLDHCRQTCAAKLRDEILPAFAHETAEGAREDLSRLETSALLERFEFWIRRTLYDFARDSLQPTVLAALAMATLEQRLQKLLGPQRSQAALGELAIGVRPDPNADLPGAVQELAAGRLDRAAFLAKFGHRGNQEMELAQPRWAEDPDSLDRLVAPANQKEPATTLAAPATWQKIAEDAHLNSVQRAVLETEVQWLHTYLGLRETAKHYLMMGYAVIRRCLVELDRRYRLGGGVFYLLPEELPRLAAGEDLLAVIAQRKRRRLLALSLEVPQVLFSDDLEAIGRPPMIGGSDTLQGVPLSAGVAEGPALVLHEPTCKDIPTEPYILVCPSTDPAWVPLFVQARGLVMETGGVLSHGAIVAREFGLPAVAGLPGIHQRLSTGQRLRVDGATGRVTVRSSDQSPCPTGS